MTDGVAAGTTTLTSATANFGTDVVGNLIYVQGGTGSITAGWYQITARTNSTTITVDRSTGLTAGTGVTLNIGGALQTPAAMLPLLVTNSTAYIKATATYSIGTGLTDSAASSGTGHTRIIGYTTTRGDRGQVTLQATAAITLLTVSGQGHAWENFIIDGNSATGTNGLSITNRGSITNVSVKNFSGYGITSNAAGGVNFSDIEISGCGTTGGFVATNNVTLARAYIHDNTVPGIVVNGGTLNSFLDIIVESNSGSSSDGIQINVSDVGILSRAAIYNNGRDGIRLTSTANINGFPLIYNVALVSNAGYGINYTPASAGFFAEMRNNAYYNNTSGARNNLTAETGAVTLTGDPFVDAANGDFRLNNTAGAGAACRAVGIPGAYPGGLTTGYADIGATQHQDSGGSGSGNQWIGL